MRTVTTQSYTVIDPGDIHRALDRGLGYEDLCTEFEDGAALDRSLTKIFNKNPSKMALAFGQAATEQRIVLDVCFGHALPLMRFVHKNFGVPQASEAFMGGASYNGRGATDNRLIRRAIDEGVDAIFTCDGSTRKKTDLVKIAKEKLRSYDSSRHLTCPPAVVVFPNAAHYAPNSRLNILKERADSIRAYLANHKKRAQSGVGHVLDLRVLEAV